jgi:hypothetical protein
MNVLIPCRIILETDAAAIASRVSRPRADTTDIVINEETVRHACKLKSLSLGGVTADSYPVSTFKDRLQQRIGQL